MEMKMIDVASGGALVNMILQRVSELILTLATNSQQYRPPMEPIRRVHELSTPSIVNKIDELTNVVKNMLAGQTNPARLCGICVKLDHPTDSCLILLEDTTTLVDVVGNFLGPPQRHYDPYSSTYNYQPPKSYLEAIVESLAISTEKFQQKTEAHFQELDQQISKLALTVSHLENQEKFSSQTESNTCQNASTVTVKDETESELVPGMSCDHDVEQEAKPAAPTESTPHKPFVVPPPYPGRLAQVKKKREDKEILKAFRKVEINIPLLDAIKQVPRYVKFLKELCIDKKKLQGNEWVNVRENVSTVLQRKISPKCKDQYRSCVYPERVLEDVLGKVNELIFSADFYIINMEDDYSKNTFDILLGRPFLSTAHTNIDVRSGTLIIEFDGEVVKFNVYEAMGQPSTILNISCVDIIEPLTKFHFEYDEDDGLQTVLCKNLDLNTMDKLDELMTFKESIRETVVFMEAPQFPKSHGKKFELSHFQNKLLHAISQASKLELKSVIETFKNSNRGKGKPEQRSSNTFQSTDDEGIQKMLQGQREKVEIFL
ncbi:uncharacterized protein [Gossypium hirsutum]|uniref:Uncharacterized protein n=1 Tax=Gossypium hirsutum TaxID=3635 RepID=A0A1U8L1U7_GOSHI|nr:uncharacterized protein LOC107921696 [Gossypium hirsutum]